MCGSAAVPNIMQNTMPRKFRRARSRAFSSLPGNGSACGRGGAARAASALSFATAAFHFSGSVGYSVSAFCSGSILAAGALAARRSATSFSSCARPCGVRFHRRPSGRRSPHRRGP